MTDDGPVRSVTYAKSSRPQGDVAMERRGHSFSCWGEVPVGKNGRPPTLRGPQPAERIEKLLDAYAGLFLADDRH